MGCCRGVDLKDYRTHWDEYSKIDCGSPIAGDSFKERLIRCSQEISEKVVYRDLDRLQNWVQQAVTRISISLNRAISTASRVRQTSAFEDLDANEHHWDTHSNCSDTTIDDDECSVLSFDALPDVCNETDKDLEGGNFLSELCLTIDEGREVRKHVNEHGKNDFEILERIRWMLGTERARRILGSLIFENRQKVTLPV